MKKVLSIIMAISLCTVPFVAKAECDIQESDASKAGICSLSPEAFARLTGRADCATKKERSYIIEWVNKLIEEELHLGQWQSQPKPEKKEESNPLPQEDALQEDALPQEKGDSERAESQTMPDRETTLADEVVNLVNAERTKRGLSALANSNTALSRASQKRATEIASSFSHTRPNGSSCFTVLGEYGVSYARAGENIAMGQSTPSEVVQAWMNSEGHRENILKPEFTEIGIGVYQSGGRYYWSQLFIG